MAATGSRVRSAKVLLPNLTPNVDLPNVGPCANVAHNIRDVCD